MTLIAPLLATLSLAAIWFAVGVLVARCLSLNDRTPRMTIDLLDLKIEALAADERAGRIDTAARHAIVATLLEHIDTIVEQQSLITLAPARCPVLAAHLVTTPGAPDLCITTPVTALSAWREALHALEFADIGITDQGYELRGPFVVRLVCPAPRLAAAEPRAAAVAH